MAAESPPEWEDGTGVQRRRRISDRLFLFPRELKLVVREMEEDDDNDDDDDTWTHCFCHLLTGPVNTGVEP